jgi:hypothetical protein
MLTSSSAARRGGRGAVKARLRAIALMVFMISFNGMVVEPKFAERL